LVAARAGSRAALGRLLELCSLQLFPLAQQQLAADLQAKLGASDLIQETLAEAFRDFRQFEGQTEVELLAWLRRILPHNPCNLGNYYRNTDKRRLDREVAPHDGLSGSDMLQEIPDDSTTPSQKALRREEAEAMEQALERLPEDYRRVILLH